MASPFGINIRQNPPDKNKIVEYMRDSGGLRSAVVQLYENDVADLNLYRPHVEKLIWRSHSDEILRTGKEGVPPFTPQQFVDTRIQALDRAGIPVESIWIHTHNEAGFSQELIDWECDVIEYGVPMGCKFVVLNLSVGTPEPHEIGRAKHLLKLMEQYPDNLRLGLHLYWERPDQDIPWYHGRYKDWFKYCDENGIRRPKIISTESGQEGVKESTPDGFWQFYAGNPDIEEAYGNDIIKSWELVLSQDVESIDLYTYGDFGFNPFNKSHDWRNYDVSKAPRLLKKLASYGRAYQQKPIEVPVPEKPWNAGIAKVNHLQYLNIWEQPVYGMKVGEIRTGDPLQYREYDAEWYQVEIRNIKGYVMRIDISFAGESPDSPPIEDRRPTDEVPVVKWIDTLSHDERRLIEVAKFWAADPCPINGANDYKLILKLCEMLDAK